MPTRHMHAHMHVTTAWRKPYVSSLTPESHACVLDLGLLCRRSPTCKWDEGNRAGVLASGQLALGAQHCAWPALRAHRHWLLPQQRVLAVGVCEGAVISTLQTLILSH